ncbi:ATP-dependent zinc metalloprotease FtsH [Clostridium sp. HMP27]|uniref:ATP-dependent zinc metalloprotease FtsH n=1 Tax=Clostridium sp. HMP27 TaxID=1487921 RepID=UPI0009DE672D|nr:ATP-dependent zinc metalloprotease FtsH [Clostridium sp. HMP27]
MKNIKKLKGPLFYYYILAFIGLMMLNTWLMPNLQKQRIVEVDYGTFLTMVNEKKINTVEIQDTKITFSSKTDEEKTVYVTGKLDDPNLVNNLKTAGVKFSKVIPKENSPLTNFLMNWILPMVLFIGMGQILGRMMQKKMGGMGNKMSFGKSNAKVYVAAQTGKTFGDVAGQDEAKEALTEIVDFLHRPDKYKEIGARLPKGALLVGPPGTGKTLLAQAVAGEAKVPFFSISGSEFVEMFVGMGAARVRDLFKQAQEKAPCIVFIDEIDAIGKKRDNSGMTGNDEREQTLNQLLTEMDGFDGGKGVVILAATNRPEILDKALLRPGRFDRRVPVELPDLKGREEILKVHTKKIKVDKNIDYNKVARATSGASGAELANIANEAALRAVRSNRIEVNQSDFDESIETVIAGYQRKGAVVPTKEKLIVAYHEIGHALVAAKQKNTAPVHKITIIPRTSGALGYTMQVEEGERVLMSKEEMLNKITTFTGGRAAEEIIFDSITTGASNDIEQATRIARAMVTRYGMSEDFSMMALETVSNQYLGGDASLACSAETAAKVDAEVLKIIKESYKKAIDILNENKDKLHELARYLWEKETISGDEFMKILNGGSIEVLDSDKTEVINDDKTEVLEDDKTQVLNKNNT